MKKQCVLTCFVACFGLPLLAEENRIFLLQVAPTLGEGNTLFVDQSAATGSTVEGVSPNLVPDVAPISGTPAVQFGSDNRGEITLRGTDSSVLFSQQGLPVDGALVPGFGNRATVLSQGASQLAVLNQLGNGNIGSVSLGFGANSIGELHQLGSNNTGQVDVQGQNSRGVLVQNGNNLDFSLSVPTDGSDVSYTLNGNDISAGASAVVLTNIGQVGPITITQTQ